MRKFEYFNLVMVKGNIMFRPKISVIIPIFNTGEYLEETLMSVLQQTMINDIEVLMIDDGSTDDSKYIIEKYALDYDNFHAFHKENEGQGVARNYGINFAKGEYIHFLDSDDYLPPNAYEKLYGWALENNSDIVCCNVLKFGRYHLWQDVLYENAFKNISENINSTVMSRCPDIVWDTSVSNKLYKNEFLLKNNLKFPNKKIFYEDLIFAFESNLLANNIFITPEVLYYWRFRSNNSSVTQNFKDLKNYKDRIYVLKAISDLFDKYSIDKVVQDAIYLKWLNHDLKVFLKYIDSFPKETIAELFDSFSEIVNYMPLDLINSLNSYPRVLYELILNQDFDNFLLFAPLENELWENPKIPEFLDDEYQSFLDFEKSLKDETLYVVLKEVSSDENSLLIDFEGKLNYLADEIYDVSAYLDDGLNEYPITISNNNQIRILLDDIADKNHLKIKITYDFHDFKKSAFLKNKSRKSIEFKDVYIDVGIGVNSHLFLDIKQKNDNSLEILDVSFDFDEFKFRGKSKNKINSVFLENVIDFKKNYYLVNYDEDDIFTFSVPYEDILNSPIKKWEINCDDSLNAIKLNGDFQFLTNYHKTRFVNTRNKILIENDISNPLDEFKLLFENNNKLKDRFLKLSDKNAKLKDKNTKLKDKNTKLKDKNIKLKDKNIKLKDKNSKLKNKNIMLKEKNNRLNERIEEYKSRKIVRIANKFR